jgi:hypothetical protein
LTKKSVIIVETSEKSRKGGGEKEVDAGTYEDMRKENCR